MELDDAILHALADGGREPQLVAEAVGAPLDDVRARLSILEAAGAVAAVEDSPQQYRLTASAD
jgi:DNA-binding Lrp family transcriptional regulator